MFVSHQNDVPRVLWMQEVTDPCWVSPSDGDAASADSGPAPVSPRPAPGGVTRLMHVSVFIGFLTSF